MIRKDIVAEYEHEATELAADKDIPLLNAYLRVIRKDIKQELPPKPLPPRWQIDAAFYDRDDVRLGDGEQCVATFGEVADKLVEWAEVVYPTNTLDAEQLRALFMSSRSRISRGGGAAAFRLDVAGGTVGYIDLKITRIK